ncbi:MAG: hypothetical protein ACJAT5_000916 [Lentimonas sp.]|jgi:hypothetical protein
MKISIYIFLISSLLPWTLNIVHSSPLVAIGDHGGVFFDGSSALIWQSNIFYDNETEKDELMLIMSPGFEATVGSKSSGFHASARANYEMQRFDNQSELNHDYLHLGALVSYEGARLNLNAAYSFDEEQTTAGQQGALNSNSDFIEMDVTRAHLVGEYVLSPKFSFEPGIRYNDREYKEEKDRLADVESYSIPLDVFYELTPKLDLSFGYEYTSEEVGIFTVEDFERELHFLNFGARGALFPKLNGSFKVGYSAVNPEGTARRSDSILGLSADFTYLTTPKLTTQLRLHRGFEVGSEGQSAENTSANLEFKYAISGNYSARLFTDLTYREFKDGNDGEDFVYRTGFRLSYVPNQYWHFGTGYSYFENDSNRTEQGFVNHVLDVSASLRY